MKKNAYLKEQMHEKRKILYLEDQKYKNNNRITFKKRK